MGHRMNRNVMNRRSFLATGAILPAAAGRLLGAVEPPTYSISLAQWSLHRGFKGEGQPKLDSLRFAEIAKTQFQIAAIEYVNTFYKDQIAAPGLARELKKRADDHGVASLLIMCDGEGDLGDPDAGKRRQAAANHMKWLELAKPLGCHSIRVNAASDKKLPATEQAKLAADGLRQLCVLADPLGLNVIVENHGGMSSRGDWLATVLRLVEHRRAGTLPDFGNFEDYDKYRGIQEMMPFAKGVSAKSYDFDTAGNETTIDYVKMMKIVRDSGYRGSIGIEYEGKRLSETEGIQATKQLLQRVFGQL